MTLGFLRLQSRWLDEEDENGLGSLKEALCSMVFSAVTDSSTQLHLVAVRILTALAMQQGFLSSRDTDLVVDHLTRLILQESDSESCMAAVEASGTLAKVHPSAFISRMLPQLCANLQTEPNDINLNESRVVSEHSVRRHCLEALAAVCTHQSILKETVPILLDYIRTAPNGEGETNAENVVSVCKSLYRVAVQCQEDSESLQFYHQTVLPCLLSLTVQAATQDSETSSHVLLKDDILTAMVPVISAACTHLKPELASKSVSQIVGLFLDGDVSLLPENNFSSKFQPFQCFAGLINKCPQGDLLDDILQVTTQRIDVGLADEPSRNQAITLLVWVTKALILRYHPLSGQLTDKMIGLLSDKQLGPSVANMFSLLVSDSPDVLNKACHADVRIMFRQRFFTENVPKLVQGFNSANGDDKPNYLKALSHVLNTLPKQVLMPELPSLLSLLLEALSCADEVVQLSTLTCLEPLLLEAPETLNVHIDGLISKLLRLTSSPAMAVRITSLKCIRALIKLPLHMLLPYKQQVIRALAKPLDDKKRLVRKEAVETRCQWMPLILTTRSTPCDILFCRPSNTDNPKIAPGPADAINSLRDGSQRPCRQPIGLCMGPPDGLPRSRSGRKLARSRSDGTKNPIGSIR
ncbi:hypothetical protein XELAEV_18004498mg [Xenopus laevis]|uniref:MMS19 nucleotide excision repair protein n=1 Tax=Xenopus laevis TaxID=8355 RepID=A0A974BR02_XENLA|nr:hypothetical protein XELAEV_18004498mg [Xenopus laevis]